MFEVLGVVDKDKGNWMWFLSYGENKRIGVLYIVLYWKLLYGVGYIVVVFAASFHISEFHVYHFQPGTLRYDVCTTQATRE